MKVGAKMNVEYLRAMIEHADRLVDEVEGLDLDDQETATAVSEAVSEVREAAVQATCWWASLDGADQAAMADLTGQLNTLADELGIAIIEAGLSPKSAAVDETVLEAGPGDDDGTAEIRQRMNTAFRAGRVIEKRADGSWMAVRA